MPPKKSTNKKQTGTSTKRARSPGPAAATAEHRPQNVPRPGEEGRSSPAGSERAESDLSTDSASPILAGKFDMYMMDLPFLSTVYLPAGQSEPQYANLYQAILKVQKKKDYTARCLLPDVPFIKDGQLKSRVSIDPMEEMPFDISIADLKLVDDLSFSSAEQDKFVTPPQSGPGITGKTALAEDHCGIQSAAGVFRMKHAWTGDDGDGGEVDIFEGYLSFKVVYSGLYRRKGHGGGSNHPFAFWAVRARRDENGVEIGLTEN
ncbi:hypothetical protein C8R43DRAFT_968151 [Mycena crocata]|nr:hypothetical protein C8R43DRAFT_968151 [Mycena crocata]